jgi:hypothetical protein
VRQVLLLREEEPTPAPCGRGAAAVRRAPVDRRACGCRDRNRGACGTDRRPDR